MLEQDMSLEEILCELEKRDYPFSAFRLVREKEKLKLIGKGSFSRVYEVESIEYPKRMYALKVIGLERHTLTSEQFWSEIRIQKILCEDIPYIVRVIAAREILIKLGKENSIEKIVDVDADGETQEGVHLQFILMEKLDEVLEKDKFQNIYLKREQLKREQEVYKLAYQIGMAIQHAHENHILHRDIKLENIFWNEDEQRYELGDFGISKIIESGYAETVVYTDGYGAPEIEKRLEKKYDVTADIYSFGITLYLLTNNLKFPGSDGYYVNNVQYNPDYIFPAPENASVGLTRVIRKMCSFYSKDRYHTMNQVLMDLIKLNLANDIQNFESENLVDVLTEVVVEEQNTVETEKELVLSHAELQRRREMMQNQYVRQNIGLFFGLTLAFTFFFISWQKNTDFLLKLSYWGILVLVLLQIGLREIVCQIQILETILTTLAITVGCITMGVNLPIIMLLVGIFLESSMIKGACVIAAAIWGGLQIMQISMPALFIESHHLRWLSIVLLVMLLLKTMAIKNNYIFKMEQLDEV